MVLSVHPNLTPPRCFATNLTIQNDLLALLHTARSRQPEVTEALRHRKLQFVRDEYLHLYRIGSEVHEHDCYQKFVYFFKNRVLVYKNNVKVT